MFEICGYSLSEVFQNMHIRIFYIMEEKHFLADFSYVTPYKLKLN